MTEVEHHLRYIKAKGAFYPLCSHEIFDHEEWMVLEKYGHWFSGLVNGELTSFTLEQERFIRVFKGGEIAQSFHEKIWFKYLNRIEIEKKYGATMHTVYHLDGDTFYKREDGKKIRNRYNS